MGVHFTLMLYDDFDWEYADTSKSEIIDNFIAAFEYVSGYKPRLRASWPYFMVWDLDKKNPIFYSELLYKYCDIAYTYDDNNPLIRQVELKQVTIDNTITEMKRASKNDS